MSQNPQGQQKQRQSEIHQRKNRGNLHGRDVNGGFVSL